MHCSLLLAETYCFIPKHIFLANHLDLDLDNSRQEPEAITATSGYALWKSGEPTLEGRYCVGLSN